MGQFFEEDDEAEQLRKKYAEESEDTSGIEAAESSSNRKRGVASLLQGLSGILNKDKSAPNSTYAAMHDRAAKQVDVAKAGKKSRLADIAEMQEQLKVKKSGEQKDAEFGWKKEANDPKANSAIVARGLIAKRHGIDAKALEGLSYDQLKDVGLKAEEAKSSGDSWQLKAVEQPDGTIEWLKFNSKTGDTVATGLKTGYKRTFDGTTGTSVSGSDATTPAIAIKTETGKPLSAERTDLEVQRAFGKGTAAQQVKDDQAVQVAGAGVSKMEDLSKRWTDLYDQAAREGPIGNTGVIGGRLGAAGAKVGFDMGPATNQGATEMEREMQKYIVDMTGLSSTDKQFQRLMSTAPHLGMARPAFQARLKVWQNEVVRHKKQKEQEASRVPAAAAAVPSAPPPAQYPKTMRNAAGDTFDAENAQEEAAAAEDGFK